MYEVENCDRGSSKIYVAESADFGKSWKNIKLIDDGSDNEPAALLLINDRLNLIYSSDKFHPKTSYSGANAFNLVCDKNFKIISGNGLPIGDGVLLLDGIKYKNKLLVYGIRNYLSSNEKTLFLNVF